MVGSSEGNGHDARKETDPVHAIGGRKSREEKVTMAKALKKPARTLLG